MSAASAPSLSLVIATHNRRSRLDHCLEALSKQTQDASEFEVIVAADGCSDGTEEMVEGLSTPYELRVLALEKRGKSAALNAGIEAARGDTCLFIDDDVVAAPELVAAHLAAYREDPRTLGIGFLRQPPPSSRDWLVRAHAEAWNRRYDEMAARGADWPDCYGGNFSAPRRALLDIGGFDTELEAIEDIELGYRLHKAGCRARYLPQAAAVHEDEKPRPRLIAEVERYGAFCARFCEQVPEARPKLLGWFLEPTPRDVTLRRGLIAARIPASAVAMAGSALPGQGRRQVWFGFVSRYAFWRGVRSATSRSRWLQTTRGVPVLMYHAFGEDEEGDLFAISRRAFALQLRLLKTLRYRPLGFGELARALQRGEPLPRRAVVITIDDGYRDNLEIARPLLVRRRFSATVFLVSGRLGGVNDWTDEGAVAGRPLLGDEEVRELEGDGIAIGAHTRNHPSLPALEPPRLAEEVAGSREDLQRLLGGSIEGFAYPYGQFDERTVEAVRGAGFEAACTVECRLARPGDDPLRIPRLEVRGTDSPATFLRKLWFGGT